jgi:hypothetical protein
MPPPDLAIQSGRFDSSPSSPRARRSHSISSDRPSTTGHGGLLSPPPATSPDSAFIAASAASQIVTNDHDSQSEIWLDRHGIEPSGETALVAQPALKLVNRFLDQLLFNFLSVSRSTSLASLRPAVAEVLKPKLAKEAISGADQELHEYLGGGEDEELLSFHNGQEPSGDWDLELVWKRTRLRCMVYSSLGDMEEEDEDFYTEQEQLDGPPGSNNRFSNNPGVVSPAVAIFLTAILEFMGEQVLVVAGQAAYHRLRAKHEKEEMEGTGVTADIAERVVVEDFDMERVALDRTLGRLWRGWKKRIRSPTTSVSMIRSFSRESMHSQPYHSGVPSIDPEQLPEEQDSIVIPPSLATVLAEHEHAAQIPLPSTEDDIREIEIPGLAYQSDHEEEQDSDADEFAQSTTRPRSMIFDSTRPYLPTPSPDAPIFTPKSRKRSHSLPTPTAASYKIPSAKRSKLSPDDVEGQEAKEGAVSDKFKERSDTASEVNAEPKSDAETEPKEDRGLVNGVVSDAVAIGTAAIAAVVAAALSGAPQPSALVSEGYDINTDEELVEEPEILTSSRVSIGGRISPDENVVPSRRSSVRSHSVHSLRLIEVTSPKDPTRSRNSSTHAFDGSPVLSSGANSIHSLMQVDSQSPRIASPVSRGMSSSPLVRNGSSMSTRQPRSNTENSISEEKEVNETMESPLTAVPADPPGAMQGVDMAPTRQPPPLAPRSVSRDVQKDTSTSGNPATFVLSAAPATRNGRSKPDQSSPDRQISHNSSNLTVGGHKAADSGVPPLTPLREMMEGAPDTSDEATSTSPSDVHSLSEYGINGHSPSVSGSSLHNQRERTARPQANSVVRSSPPRASREEAIRREKRPTHTSGSSSSSTSHKLKPVRTSEDSGQKGNEDKGQSFEQLIRSDQTIQYTLTPQNMRDIEVCILSLV